MKKESKIIVFLSVTIAMLVITNVITIKTKVESISATKAGGEVALSIIPVPFGFEAGRVYEREQWTNVANEYLAPWTSGGRFSTVKPECKIPIDTPQRLRAQLERIKQGSEIRLVGWELARALREKEEAKKLEY